MKKVMNLYFECSSTQNIHKEKKFTVDCRYQMKKKSQSPDVSEENAKEVKVPRYSMYVTMERAEMLNGEEMWFIQNQHKSSIDKLSTNKNHDKKKDNSTSSFRCKFCHGSQTLIELKGAIQKQVEEESRPSYSGVERNITYKMAYFGKNWAVVHEGRYGGQLHII